VYLNKYGPAYREKFALAVGTSPMYLDQLAKGFQNRRITPEMAARIERASSGNVRCEELLPELAKYLAYMKWRPTNSAEKYDLPNAPVLK